MNKIRQIKTHFDINIISFFIILLILSCLLLLYKKKINSNCSIDTFSIQADSYKEGGLIVFSDTTKKSYDWVWDFGDGSKVSYLSKVSHSYEKAGKYKVRLTVNTTCVVEKAVEILAGKKIVDATLYPKFEVPKNITQGQEVVFRDNTKNAKTWEWRFGDEKGFLVDATSQTPSYTYKNAGKKVVTLVVNGDYDHVTKIPVFVNKEKKDTKAKPDIVVGPIKIRGPKIKGMDEDLFLRSLVGISQNTLDFTNFSKYFCKGDMPQVNVNDKQTISLKELDEQIRDKKIKIKKVSLQTDDDGCVTFINLNYK